jgi:D-glycero-D-manno-heptose 1,7-bisphosphate phosphatase
MRPAIFLDRDGVIIENRANYVRSWSDVSIYPQALQALASVSESEYALVLVTNQSAVGRGILPLRAVDQINARLLGEIKAAGGRIDGIYVCPHAPQDGCNCRKPGPGLILQAAQELSLDLSRSILIGDALSDIQAGQSAGVRKNVLVLTGRGLSQSQLPRSEKLKPFLIYATLADALAALAR